ncbi:MAG: TonB-dependent receptor [Bacteroidota bacterium]
MRILTQRKPGNLFNCRWFLTSVLFLAFMMPGYVSGSYAQEMKLTLSLKEVTLKKALQEIEQQSEFTFVYNDAMVDVQQIVSVKVNNASISKLLDALFEKTDINHEVLKKKIILTPKKASAGESSALPRQDSYKVEGTVTDEQTGETLPGVNITIKNSSQGTITDVEGKFTLQIPSDIENPELVFSFMGYIRKTVPVDGREVINVSLSRDVQRLDEVVVIGYGESSRKLLTSSISSVQSEDLEDVISNGVQEALQGKTSGVSINRNSGTPGAAPTMSIRGLSSISAGTQPLYVVDGIPVTSGDYSQISMEGQSISAIANINPDNIESISVLKDASAAAIYGARAGNGVVLIETKTGQAGKTKFSFKTYTGMQEVYKRLDLLNAEQWKDYVVNFEGVSDDFSGIHPEIERSWLEEGVDTDWLDEVFRTAPVENVELSASGAKERMKFYVSGRYFSQQGVVIGTNYDKFSGRININYNLTDKLDLGIKTNTTHSINDRVRGDQSVNGPLPNAISAPPVAPVKDELGNYPLAGWWDNPVAVGKEVVNQAETFHNVSNIFAEYRFSDHLKIKNQWGVDYYNLQERRFEPSFVKSAKETNGYGADASSNVLKLTQQTTANYNNTFNDVHDLNLLLGYSFEKWNTKYLFMSGTEFPNDDLQYLESAALIDVDETESALRESALSSFFGRIKYNYDNKYLMDFTLRRDGSSNFGENNRFAYLPSVSFAWRAIEEDFLSGNEWLSDLKLKTSFGLTGNDDIGAFGALNLYSAGFNYYSRPGIVPTQIPNPDLKWETTENYNVGLNLGFLKNRITFSADAYYNHTTDLLLARPVPLSSGFGSMNANVGALENRGLEFELYTENIKRELTWNTSFNISFNQNEVLELYNDQPLTPGTRGNNAVIVGEPIGVFYMYESHGVDPATGDLLIEDVNNDGVINDNDRQIVGSPHPDFSGGLNNSFKYKDFSLSFFIQFTYGNEIYNGVRQYTENMTISNDNQLTTVLDRWMQPGDETYVPRLNGRYNNQITSHYIEDGSYARLKNVTFSYNLPVDKLGIGNSITSARIYFQGENLYTLTSYSGMDPEVNYSGVSNITRGVDFFTYPQVRMYTLGINMKF